MSNWFFSPAKLNLFLHITGQRTDGYHELQTLFQLLDFGDRLGFESGAGPEINVECPGLDIPAQENLVFKAAEALQQATGCSTGANIVIEKYIPHGGGLGGGSSNAATTLLVLNQLWELNLDTETLCDIGLHLGADVPVFVQGHSAWAEGIGERLTPVTLEERWYLVLKPDCSVATGQIFSHQELTRTTAPIRIAAFFEQGGNNDCEAVVTQLYPEVRGALDWLNQFASGRLTGTGACIFAAFDEQAQAEDIRRRLPDELQGFVARGINQSPVQQQMKQL